MPNTGTLPEVMPPPIQTVLVPHAPNWPQCAGQQRQKIRVPGSILLTVHHIGSTCVPALTARPIIDLMPLVTRWLILTGNVGAMRHVTLPSEMTCAGILTWRLLTPLKSAAPRHLQLSDSHAYSDENAAWIRDTVTKALVWLNGQQTAGFVRPSLD